jgi:hypothetical protein
VNRVDISFAFCTGFTKMEIMYSSLDHIYIRTERHQGSVVSRVDIFCVLHWIDKEKGDFVLQLKYSYNHILGGGGGLRDL